MPPSLTPLSLTPHPFFTLLRRYPGSTSVSHPLPHVISKIESVEALVNFDSILEVSDAIMVARGE